ncbi:MAG: biotin--[acetyl-CoA-carboxylase] ligase [Dissulfuribacterales bacterium]
MENRLKEMVNACLLRKQAKADANDSILKRSLNHACRRMYYMKSAERLMPLAKQAILDAEAMGASLPSGSLWIAEELIAAKGRMTRQWWSPKGGIYLCIAIHPVLLHRNWAHYNLAVGAGIANALRNLGITAFVKWVNDVFLNGKKLAGVLSETVRSQNEIYLLFGIGINVNQQSFPANLPFATSLLLETGQTWDITELTGAILAEICWLFGAIEEWEAENLMEDPIVASHTNPVLLNWQAVTDTIGKTCVYGNDALNHPELRATAAGIAHDGNLLLETEDHQTINVSTGEIWYL